ncbi:hypothetical protein GCM10017673_47880 [Streptosporangium violaceochromogenes]|nr:hypothetical protein GCM10017673_47880 [Streptosporangium violaceochromogenes]
MVVDRTAEWSATLPGIRQVAVLGAIALFGTAGCAAEGTSGSPQENISPVAQRSSVISRENIEVQLQPARVKAGQKVWILANCPIPEGGPEHRGTAASKAFRAPVALDPILATPSPSASAGATPAARPWVRGQAVVATGVAPGVYDVNARCEGTNDTGKAGLRVVGEGKKDEPTDKPADKPRDNDGPRSTPKPKRTIISTHAPGTGGGGTAARDTGGAPGMPSGVAVVVLVTVLAGGAGVAAARRRRP